MKAFSVSTIFALAVALVPMASFAHGSATSMVGSSSVAALEKFANEEKAALATFSGIKSWISGSSAKVRVYFDNNQNSVVYGCIMHHGTNGEEHLICTKE